LRYLDHIKQVWHKLLRGDKQALQKVDQVTVKALELKAPKSSGRDAQVLQGQLLSGQIFGVFSQQDREAIWSELSSIEGLIPTLYSCFEDIKYLQGPADCIKRLIKLSPRDTVYTAMEQSFSDVNQVSDQCLLQEADSTFTVTPGNAGDRFDLGYRQIWLYAMRHFREMPVEPKKKKKNLLAKPGARRADETVLCEFAALADRLGFESGEISALKQRSSDREIARNALLEARKSNRFEYSDALFESHIAQIVGMFSTATPTRCERAGPALVADDPNASGNRCGSPDEQAHEEDVKSLFITSLHNAREEQGETITSFFVRRSVYFVFLGKLMKTSVNGSPGLPRPHNAGAQQVESTLEDLDIPSVPLEDVVMQGIRQGGAEQDRLVQEQERAARLEEERLEQERLEQERLEQERL